MKLNKLILITVAFMFCSPSSTPKNGLIGKWENGFMIGVSHLNPDGSISVDDTIYDTTEIQFVGNEMNIGNREKYKNHVDQSKDTTLNYNYVIFSDTLNVVSKDSRKSYYHFAVKNDSLTLLYMYGDTIKVYFGMVFQGNFKKE